MWLTTGIWASGLIAGPLCSPASATAKSPHPPASTLAPGSPGPPDVSGSHGLPLHLLCALEARISPITAVLEGDLKVPMNLKEVQLQGAQASLGKNT